MVCFGIRDGLLGDMGVELDIKDFCIVNWKEWGRIVFGSCGSSIHYLTLFWRILACCHIPIRF